MNKGNLEQIADYVWLGKTQRSWHIWFGNPFHVGLYTVPLKEYTKNKLIAKMKKENEKEKKRFTKLFPHVKWKTI